MKVLFQNSRPYWSKQWGGDSTQLVKTAHNLEKLGVSVAIAESPAQDVRGFDLVHVFNIQTAHHGLPMVEKAKLSGVPVVLSTIYWDFSQVDLLLAKEFPVSRFWPLRLLGRIDWRLFYWTRRLLVTPRTWRQHAEARRMLELADVLLPNSYAELEIIVRTFGFPLARAKSLVVPNAADSEYPSCRELPLESAVSKIPQPYVLEVGRIEPLKGQLKVIKALMDYSDVPLVFVGREGNPTYAMRCRKAASQRGNTFFLGEIRHDQLPCVYRGAKVHVLPSLRESPGLVSLEAGVLGVNCVVSVYGPVTEYFGSDAWYCDPSSLDSIRTAILDAWQAPRNEDLRQRVLRDFTWDRAAEVTLKAYEWVLSRRGKS